MGNNYADNFTYFEVSFKRWQGEDSKGNDCKSDSQIDEALNKASLAMAVINTYYDFDNYTSPVQTYFDDQFFYDFVAGFEKETDVYVRQNSVEQKDSFFRYTPNGDESNFISKKLIICLISLLHLSKITTNLKYKTSLKFINK